jgi:hypothetical protein
LEIPLPIQQENPNRNYDDYALSKELLVMDRKWRLYESGYT